MVIVHTTKGAIAPLFLFGDISHCCYNWHLLPFVYQ